MRFSRLVVAAICCSTAVLSQQNDIEGGLLDEEMRIDPKDGYSKSYSQFLEHYGETEGAHLWRSAIPVGSDHILVEGDINRDPYNVHIFIFRTL